MKYVFAVLFFCTMILAQNSAPATQPSTAGKTSSQSGSSTKTAPKSQRRGDQSHPDEGSVSGNTYTEKFFNLSCTIPAGWVIKTAAMREGLAGQGSSMLLLSTFAKDSPSAGEVNASLTITAESLAAYPDVKTASDYFSVISELARSKGFTVLNEPAEIDIGGVTFLRGDFQKEEEGKPTYQASMVTIRNGYALAATAISGNDEDLTPLLNRVRVFAQPSLRKP